MKKRSLNGNWSRWKMKTKYKFEIQNLINVIVEAKNKEEARLILIDNIDDYADQMVNGDCYVSDGEEVNSDE